VKPVAVAKARQHLQAAAEAAEQLDIANGYGRFEQAWSDVLSQLSRCYSKLEQGAKGCSTSEPWFGRKKQERKVDPLLAYIHHARNSDEHGLDYITQRAADSASLHFPPTNEVNVSFEMMVDDKGAMHVRNPQVKSPNGGVNRVEIVNPRVELVSVRDRGVIYDPPIMHAGKPIVNASPQSIAKLAVRHSEALIEEAAKLPQH
jgi:hypothetical protein